MRLKEIMDWIEGIAPLHLQESYDNSGLIIGSEDQMVNKAVVCLDVDEAVLAYAREKGASLVISHHPCVFRPLKTFSPNTPEGAILYAAITHGIAVYSAHTNFDSARGGMGDLICRELELDEIHVLSPGRIPDAGHGIGRWGSYRSPLAYKDFLGLLGSKLGMKTMREVGRRPEQVSRVAVLNGSFGHEFMDDLLRIKPDVLLTGDLKYHDALVLNYRNIYTLDAGHYQSEIIFVRGFSQMLGESFPELEVLEWEGSDIFKAVSSID
ncbi:MAG TPA: Nif3-like dinuclear metal center hexameric protein [Thermoclostridium caenicola]|nr:Nif3-like dinuclear metal center hexameric protein [Thermoclostridium caenicola]